MYEYLTLEVGEYVFQVKFEDEGVVLDVFDDDNNSVATTYAFYDELPIERSDEEEWDISVAEVMEHFYG